MSAPLQVLLAVEPDAAPVVEFLRRRGQNIGSVRAALVADNAPADARCLCVGVVDAQAVDDLARAMAAEIVDPKARALVGRALVRRFDLDTFVVVFPDIAAVEVPPVGDTLGTPTPRNRP